MSKKNRLELMGALHVLGLFVGLMAEGLESRIRFGRYARPMLGTNVAVMVAMLPLTRWLVFAPTRTRQELTRDLITVRRARLAVPHDHHRPSSMARPPQVGEGLDAESLFASESQTYT